jgi:hypothetical protein
MYGFLKYKMGNMEGLMNPKNSKILSDLPNKLLNDVTIDVSPSTFCQELKYAKWVLLSHEVLLTLNPWFWW